MDRMHHRGLFALVVLLVFLCIASEAVAQEARFTFLARGLSLDDAIQRFSDLTGAAVSYDPALARGGRAYCRAEKSTVEDLLQCILRGSGLDYHRLSSGTFVLQYAVEAAPLRGYLAGSVTDEETGMPLQGAHVYVSGTNAGASTNESGYFTLPPLLPGRHPVTITYVGYNTWHDTLTVRASRRRDASIGLRSEPVLVSPVIVNAVQRRRSTSELDFSGAPREATPSGAAAFGRRFSMLDAVPGARVHDVTADVHVHDGDAGMHDLRLDGVSVFMPRALLGVFGPFSPPAVSRIAVHKTGFAARYGSQLGSILSVEQRLDGRDSFELQADPLALNGRLEITGDTPRGTNYDVAATARTGLWDVGRNSALHTMLGEWSRPDLFALAAPFGASFADTLNRQFAFLARAASPHLDLTDIHLTGRVRYTGLRSLQGSLYHGQSGIEGGALHPSAAFADGSRSIPLTLTDDYRWINSLGQIRYQAVTSNRTIVGLQLIASRYRHENRYTITDALTTAVPQDLFPGRPHRDSNGIGLLGLKSTLDYAFDRHDLRLGLDVQRIASRFDLRGVHLSRDEFVQTSGAYSERFETAGIRHRMLLWTSSAYIDDEIALGRRTYLQAGLRTTFLPERATVYAEPRLGLLVQGQSALLGSWSSQSGAGIYRQFLTQMDASKLSPGAVLSSVRIWLPADRSIRPPFAVHVSQEAVIEPTLSWALHGELYLRYLPNEPALRYIDAGRNSAVGRLTSQSEFMTGLRSLYAGSVVSIEWHDERGRMRVQYAYSYSDRRQSGFDRGVSAPWTEPHRLQLGTDWRILDAATLSARWQGIWGRSWGYRRAYYDYLSWATPGGQFGLNDPAGHVLPALHQLDLAAAYSRPIGRVHIQLRFELLNALGRRNVASWRLVPDNGEWQQSADHYYGRTLLWGMKIAM